MNSKKTKREDDDVGEGRQGGAKRRHLEPLLETEAKFLLHDFKTSDELLKLYDRVIDLEDRLVEKMDFDDGIRAIEGAKVEADKNVLWLLVRWEGDYRSFIPANVLRKIAPGKLLKYYESRMQIFDQPITGPVGVTHLTRPQPPQSIAKPPPARASAKPPVPNIKAMQKKIGDTVAKQSRPTKPPGKPPVDPTQPVPIIDKYKTMNCIGCRCLLQFPPKTSLIRCPKCQTQMATIG